MFGNCSTPRAQFHQHTVEVNPELSYSGWVFSDRSLKQKKKAYLELELRVKLEE